MEFPQIGVMVTYATINAIDLSVSIASLKKKL